MLPDFLIIGAAKSGTTWLVQCLKSNPEIFIPSCEIHYFSRHFDEGEAWYTGFFKGAEGARAIGENSNSYLNDPVVPARIRDYRPDMKLVVILRNPIERAYSGYCMQLKRGKVDRDVASYLDPHGSRVPHILENGLYAQQLTRYLDIFPAEQLRVLLYDDMRADVERSIRDLTGWLGVPFAFDSEVVQQHFNSRPENGISLRYKRMLWPLLSRERIRRPLMRAAKQSGLLKAVEPMLAQKVNYPALDHDLKVKLENYYAPDIERLSNLLKRDLSFWLDR